MYTKYLNNFKEWLEKQKYLCLLCKTGRLPNTDLLFFEMNKRTHFIWVEKETDPGFWFGEVEWRGQSPSIGATWYAKFSDTILKHIIDTQKKSNHEDLNEFGKLIQFGEQMLLKEIKKDWMDFEQNLFLFQFYESNSEN